MTTDGSDVPTPPAQQGGGPGGQGGGPAGGEPAALDRIPPRPRGDVDPPPPPDDFLEQHGARVLDPVTAMRLPGQGVRTTVYTSNRLLVPDTVWSDAAFHEVLGRLGDVDLRPDTRALQLAEII